MIPQINSLSVKPQYLGFSVSLGETPEHLNNAPLLTKIDGKKIVYLCIGASTPSQISTQLELLGKPLNDITIVNCCVYSEDINKWLNPNGNGWLNVASKLKAKGIPYSRVQGIIMCNDDLKDQGTGVTAINLLADKLTNFIQMAKDFFVNLRTVDLFSRLCDIKIDDPKFASPTGYNNGFANKLVTEACIDNGGRLFGVWVTDGTGYLWTDGETVRSDGFHFQYSWMRQSGHNVHFDTNKQGDEICAGFIFNNMKRYSWFR